MQLKLFLSILYLVTFFLIIVTRTYAQKDTVFMKRGDVLTGEVVSLEHEILLFKTAYTTTAISLKWNDVIAFNMFSKLKVSSIKNRVVVGSIYMDTINKSSVKIFTNDSSISIKRDQILEISKFDKRLPDRLKMDIDLGVIKTKANNSDQVSLEMAVKYLARRWEFDLDYSAYAATVDTISTNRASLGLTARYNFQDNWFLLMQVNTFTSTEQEIDYRATYFWGGGKYMVRRNKINLYGYFGGTFNKEKFTISQEVFKTAEAFGGLHLEVSPVEKLRIESAIIVYPSLSESGRIRTYSKTDITMNFIKHFRFGMGYVLNADSRPPVNSSKSDYLFNIKFGWSL